MSAVTVLLEYSGKLWPMEDFSFTNGIYKVDLNFGGVSLTTVIDIRPETKAALVESILAQKPNTTPSLQNIPVELHRDIFEIERLVRTGARRVDELLRWSALAVRLPTYEFRRSPLNATPSWPTVRWNFDEDDCKDLATHLTGNVKELLDKTKGVTIPLPYAFESRAVELHGDHIRAFGDAFQSAEPVPMSSFSLFAIAWENYERQVYPSAVIILTACLETVVKWHLLQSSNNVAQYLLDNMQSPPLDKLLSCARKYAGLAIPKRFQKWATELIRYRNGLVHKPNVVEIPPLLVARWFAIGEAVLRAVRGLEVEPMAGAYIQVHPSISNLPPVTRGIVLRRETDHGESTLHVIMDSGITARFHNNAVQELDTDSHPIQ